MLPSLGWLVCWIKCVNESCRKKSALEAKGVEAGGTQSTIQSSQVKSFVLGKNCGVYWKLHNWNAYCDLKDLKHLKVKKKEVSIPGEGPGVIREEDDYGCPIGAIRLTDTMMHMVKRAKDMHTTELDNEDGMVANDSPAVFRDLLLSFCLVQLSRDSPIRSR